MDANDFLDIIYPKHDRTSCSDDDTSNGFYSQDEDGRYRCRRCAMLEVIKGNCDYGLDLPSVENIKELFE